MDMPPASMKPLPVASSNPKAGQKVYAIGNPGLGSDVLEQSITEGIVSSASRTIKGQKYVQHTAAVNPGNSGGPMINLKGQVIGINSAIASTTGGYQGYGFAIPINLARRVMEDLVEFGHVRRPRIGVRIAAVSAEDAEAYGLPSVSGILVQGVNEGGPSDGQLEAEDVIVAIEDEPVGYVAELQARVAEFRPGDRIKVSLYRDGRLMDAEIRLDEAPINEIPTVVTVRTGEPDERLGINVEVVDLEEIASLGWENADGVFLTQVARGSPADRRGVGGYLGTKIVRVQDVAISTPADVRRALGGVDPGEIVSLHFEYPNGDQQVVNVRMPR